MKVVKIYNKSSGWWETNCSHIPHAHEMPHRVGYFTLDENAIKRLIELGNDVIEADDNDLEKLIKIRDDMISKIALINAVKEPHVDQIY